MSESSAQPPSAAAPPRAMRQPPRGASESWRSWAAGGLILAVFAGVVAAVSATLRTRLQDQVLRREGEVLQAVAQLQQELVAEGAAPRGAPIDDEALAVALQTARMRGVAAVRLFDANGEFLDSVPVEVEEGALGGADLAELQAGRPVVRFHAAFPLDDLFLIAEPGQIEPLLEIVVALAFPARAGEPMVAVQYWFDGADVREELGAIDRRVLGQAAAAFGAGSILIAGTLAWALRRLARANRLLAARAEDLAQANRELAQTARTAAIGAITAHLMHGLRNPLAGLEGFVSAQTGREPGADAGRGEGEWGEARESTKRMRRLVDEALAVLSDVETGASYAAPASELLAQIRERVTALAREKEVALDLRVHDDPALSARAAALGGLALANLAQNAIEAAPSGSRVVLEAARPREAIGASRTPAAGVDFFVADAGPGLAPELCDDPFRPRRSAKPHGAGLGLAISRELARHAGGELTLASSGPTGTVFRLRLPIVDGGPAHG